MLPPFAFNQLLAKDSGGVKSKYSTIVLWIGDAVGLDNGPARTIDWSASRVAALSPQPDSSAARSAV